MTEGIHVPINHGIISTGDNADNRIYHVQPPEGGWLGAEQVPCPARRIAELGPHTAGRLFVGREEELAELDAALAGGSGVITTGMGGVGKSTLAHRYAELHQARYNPVWWIDAESPEEIEAGLAALARRLYPDLAGMPDEDAAAWGRAWLAGHDGWLLILDNATRPADITGLAGTANGGRLLLTSRLTVGWEEIAEPVSISILAPEQSADLMARAVGRKELLDGAGELCEALGHLPLAIRMAAAYMKETGVTAATYLDRLTGHGAVLEWRQAGGDSERTVARIWQKSLDQIARDHGAFPQELLRILAWLAPSDIPVTLLHGLPERTSDQIDEALGRLAAYGLIARSGDAVTVHRLVQAASRHAAGRENTVIQAVATAREQTTALLRAAVPHVEDLASSPLWRLLVPHVDALASHTEPADDDATMLALLDRIASFLQRQGQVSRAIAMFERAETGMVRLYGPENPETLGTRARLASAYRAAGDLRRAIPLLEQTLADRERILGLAHADTLSSRNSLAGAYRAIGDFGRAIPLFEQTLADRERILGPEHPDTLISRNNLAVAYGSAGDRGGAHRLHQQTLEDRERILGPEHPSTLLSRNNLARAQRLAGNLDQAIELYQQTLADRERILGPEHPSTLNSRNDLAYAFREAGNLDRAIELYQQTLADRERILGPEHPDTLASRNNLARAQRLAGNLDQAIELYQQTLTDRERILGPEHPSTLTSRNNLGYAYQEAGDLGRAIPLLEQTLADRERVLGAEHPSTLHSRNRLAGARLAAGDMPQAIALFEQALADSERILGPDHPDTRTARDQLKSLKPD